MRIGEILPCRTCTNMANGIVSPETSGQGSPRIMALSSTESNSGSQKSRVIAIAVKGHTKWRDEPFKYVFTNLIEEDSKVVVISCLSQVTDEMGVPRRVDVHQFGGLNSKSLEAAVKIQIKNLNHFLSAFREGLRAKGVPMDIRVATGPQSLDILLGAVRALRPHWLVLDLSFERSKRNIKAAVECNLLLIRGGHNPELLRRAPHAVYEEDDSLQEHPGNSSPLGSSKTSDIVTTPSTMGTSVRIQNPGQTPAASSSCSKVWICITRLCVGRDPPDEHVNGPTETQTVLYGPSADDSQATYLGKVSKTREDLSIDTDTVNIEGSAPGSFFKLGSQRN